jgi:anti-sigma regulatory factor (Ser/Thr protein kinase)
MRAESSRDDVELELPPDSASVTRARHALIPLARQVGAAAEDVALAVSEAVGNAVVHAFRGAERGTISVRGAVGPDALVVTVADDGIGMMPNLHSPGLGLGASLISRLADEARFESSEEGTTITMRFDRSS